MAWLPGLAGLARGWRRPERHDGILGDGRRRWRRNLPGGDSRDGKRVKLQRRFGVIVEVVQNGSVDIEAASGVGHGEDQGAEEKDKGSRCKERENERRQ